MDTITGDDGVAMPVMYLDKRKGTPDGGATFGRQWAKVRARARVRARVRARARVRFRVRVRARARARARVRIRAYGGGAAHRVLL